MERDSGPEPNDEKLAELIENAILSDLDPDSEDGKELAEFLPVIHKLRRLANSDSNVNANADSSEQWPFIGKYRVTGLLGRGGQSVVFLALDPDLERRVVLKLYSGEHDESWVQSLIHEGRFLARLHCRYFARCFAIDRVDGLPYLVLEYIPGTTLGQVIAEEEISVDQAVELISKIAVGLAEIHAHGLIHGDLKPSNIVVGLDGDPRIVDFGLATNANQSSPTIRGTAAYMARELANGEIVNPDIRSDIYSLGVIFYEMLTAERPGTGNPPGASNSALDTGKITPPERLNPKVMSRVSRACMRCLAKRSDRYSSVAEFLTDLQPKRRAPYLAVAAGVAVMIVGLLIWIGVSAHDRRPLGVSTSVPETKTVIAIARPGEHIIDSHGDGFESVAISTGSPVPWGEAEDKNSYRGWRRHPFPRDPAGTSKGRWAFRNLAAGIYQVAATWTSQSNRSSAAPFTILDGSATRASLQVNQEIAPVGFAVSDGEKNLTCQTLAPRVAIISGQLTVELTNVNNSDGGNYVIADAVVIQRMGDLPGAIIMDDSDAGFSTVSVPSGAPLKGWGEVSEDGYINRNRHYPFQYMGAGITKARWVFQDLPSGVYQVSASWIADQNRSSAAPYTILDGTTVRATTTMNQETRPTDVDGLFQHLGAGVEITSGQLTVELTNVDNSDRNNYVIADAIRVQRIGD